MFYIIVKCGFRRKCCFLKVYFGFRVVVYFSSSLMCIIGISSDDEIGRVWDFYEESIGSIYGILNFNIIVMNFCKWLIRKCVCVYIYLEGGKVGWDRKR